MTSTPLGSVSIEEFLSKYWQKKPLLIRQAFPGFESPLEPDELAGLALQDNVLSRLILEKGGDYPWQLKQGPLSEADFENLGEHHWTVLVQEVDKHVPAVADLFDQFQFLPNWRKDDVMVSFATHDAGVGAHTDSYDVFLLQGSGRRRWEIGAPAAGKLGPADGGIRASGAASGGPAGGQLDTQEHDYVPGLDVRMLANFEATEVFELEPGDMLYLPPGVPHNGVAIEPCLTFSFGFLAPTRADIVGEFSDWQKSRHGAIRYRDEDLTSASSPGLITADDLRRVVTLMTESSIDQQELAEWFGQFITRPQRAPAETEEFEGRYQDFVADFVDCEIWRRHEGVRAAAWVEGKVRLFFDGEAVEQNLDAARATALAAQREIAYLDVADQDDVLQLLYNFTCRGWGYLLPAEDDEDE